MLFQYIRSPTHRTGTVISVFYNPVACSGHHKTSRRRNIERIFSIPSRTDNIDRIMTIQIHDHPPFENGFPKPGQFFRRNTTHQKNGHKSRQLAVVIPAVGNVQQDLFSFFFREAFVPEHFI